MYYHYRLSDKYRFSVLTSSIRDGDEATILRLPIFDSVVNIRRRLGQIEIEVISKNKKPVSSGFLSVVAVNMRVVKVHCR